MRRVEARYRGRVQGVGFRATVRELAASFAVAGWVKNEADGSVCVVAEGDEAEVEYFLESIYERMVRNVQSVDRVVGHPVGESGFEIRR